MLLHTRPSSATRPRASSSTTLLLWDQSGRTRIHTKMETCCGFLLRRSDLIGLCVSLVSESVSGVAAGLMRLRYCVSPGAPPPRPDLLRRPFPVSPTPAFRVSISRWLSVLPILSCSFKVHSTTVTRPPTTRVVVSWATGAVAACSQSSSGNNGARDLRHTSRTPRSSIGGLRGRAWLQPLGLTCPRRNQPVADSDNTRLFTRFDSDQQLLTIYR